MAAPACTHSSRGLYGLNLDTVTIVHWTITARRIFFSIGPCHWRSWTSCTTRNAGMLLLRMRWKNCWPLMQSIYQFFTFAVHANEPVNHSRDNSRLKHLIEGLTEICACPFTTMRMRFQRSENVLIHIGCFIWRSMSPSIHRFVAALGKTVTSVGMMWIGLSLIWYDYISLLNRKDKARGPHLKHQFMLSTDKDRKMFKKIKQILVWCSIINNRNEMTLCAAHR